MSATRSRRPAAGCPSAGYSTPRRTSSKAMCGAFGPARGSRAISSCSWPRAGIWRVPGRALALVGVSGGSVTAPFSTAATTRWRTVQYGDTIVAVNFENATQAYDLRSGGSFLPLAAAAPKGTLMPPWCATSPCSAHGRRQRHGVDAYRVQWHGFVDGLPDVTEWTPTASNRRLSAAGGHQAGAGLTGGAFGTIVGESGVSLMEYGGACSSSRPASGALAAACRTASISTASLPRGGARGLGRIRRLRRCR